MFALSSSFYILVPLRNYAAEGYKARREQTRNDPDTVSSDEEGLVRVKIRLDPANMHKRSTPVNTWRRVDSKIGARDPRQRFEGGCGGAFISYTLARRKIWYVARVSGLRVLTRAAAA